LGKRVQGKGGPVRQKTKRSENSELGGLADQKDLFKGGTNSAGAGCVGTGTKDINGGTGRKKKISNKKEQDRNRKVVPKRAWGLN